MTRPWKPTRLAWSMTQTTRNCLMVLGGIIKAYAVSVIWLFSVYCINSMLTFFLGDICRCIEQINKANRGEISQDELQERQVTILEYAFVFFGICSFKSSDSVNCSSCCLCRTKLCKTQRSRTFLPTLSCDRYHRVPELGRGILRQNLLYRPANDFMFCRC